MADPNNRQEAALQGSRRMEPMEDPNNRQEAALQGSRRMELMAVPNNRQEAVHEGGCRLAKLATEFTPERITLHIELVPQEGCAFDAPMSEPGKRLGMVANYARTVFDVAMQQRGRQKRVKRIA